VCGKAAASFHDVVRSPTLHARLRDALAEFNRHNAGSSRRVKRVLLMTEPPSIDGNEITDKGYINQRAVLARRAALVDRLYSNMPHPDVVVIEADTQSPTKPARAAAGA
jgi:feruloyl-CoA synthase